MLSPTELAILNQYYLKLEAVDEVTPLIQPDNFVWDESSEELRVKISIEINALSSIDQKHIVKVFKDREEMVHQYFTKRIGDTKNSLLKAKYHHFSYCLTRNNKDVRQAVEDYQSALESCLNSNFDQNRHIKFQEILDVIIELTKRSKYKLDELKNQIHTYLDDPHIYGRMKTGIIESAINSKLFKPEELAYIPKLACAIAGRETGHRFIEINLLLGLDIAKKIQDEKLIKEISELLGDNEYQQIKEYDGRAESMMVPHQNNFTYVKIIQYYKHSGNKGKIESATLAYNANKKHTKFLKIEGPVNQHLTVEKIEEAVTSISSLQTKVILYHLIWGDILPLRPNEVLDNYVDQEKDNIMYKLMKTAIHDLNNNGKEISVADHLRFEAYNQKIPLTVGFVSDIIINAIQNKKLSYSKVAKILGSTMYFGQVLTISRDGVDLEYTWFNMIDIGIKSFFEHWTLILKGKEPDWRLTVDILSLKFEGILRDMVGLVDGVITKVDNNGNTSELLLEDLLRNKATEKVFTKNDINLFQFIFTSKGYNIRNDVAHSFYKPHDYSMRKAILVVLCILRLAKFNYIMAKDAALNKDIL